MTETWDDVTLDDVSDDITVGHVGPMADQYIDVGVPFLRSLNVEPFRINTTDLKYISMEFHQRLKKSALKPGDSVIVRTGKPGSCAVIPDWLLEANCSDVVVVRPGPKVRPDYISYVINSTAAHHIDAYTVGAVQQHFNVASARQIRFRLPPIVEQDRILSILGALNHKIDLNRRMNDTLGALARSIFKDWFLDFGPTRAKMEGGAPYLAPKIWAMFPDRLDGEGKPEGWNSSPLYEVMNIISGGTPKTNVAEYWDGTIPWFSVVDAPALSDVFVLDTQKHITEGGLASCAASLLPIGVTIVTARGTVGKLAVTGSPMAMNQSCYALSGKLPLARYSTYYLIHDAIRALQANTHGSVFDTITRETFKAVRAIIPTSECVLAYENAVAPMMERILSNGRVTMTLVQTRDLLLPKLMSGEIRMKDAESEVEAIA